MGKIKNAQAPKSSKKNMVFNKQNNKDLKKNLVFNKQNKKDLMKKDVAKKTVKVPKFVETKSQITVVKPPKPKYIMPSKYVTEHIVSSCLEALDKLCAKSKREHQLFQGNALIFAEINSIKIPKTVGTVKIILPNSAVTASQEVNIIVADEKPTNAAYHDEIIKTTIIKNVIPLRELRTNYDQYELQRRFFTQQDFLLVDTRVYNHARHVLGNRFTKKHNMLIPVRLNRTNVKKGIDIALRTTLLRVSEGPTSTVAVGNMEMDRDKVKKNILSMVEQLKKFPGGEANIRSINIKLPLSMSLPIYFTLRPSKSLNTPKFPHSKSKHIVDVEGELSTILGAHVKVTSEGKVHVNIKKDNKGNFEAESEEEEIAEEKTAESTEQASEDEDSE